jgi:Fe-S-cluster containining protein
MFESESELEGRSLRLEESFHFHCHPALGCFNRCCRNKRLPLLPYDVLRLRRALGVPSHEILDRYAELEIDPESGWPLLRIKLEPDGRCPFVKTTGCQVYAHRPACCRIYPLYRAVRPGRDGQAPIQRFQALQPAGCQGWHTPRSLRVSDYLDEQGLEPYHRANNRSLELFLHPARPRPLVLDERQIHATILSLYNFDLWRQTVASDGFAKASGFPPARLEAALGSEEKLLELGQQWLARLLFGQQF